MAYAQAPASMNTAPKEISARGRLGALAGRLDSINLNLGEAVNALSGDGQEAAASSPPSSNTIHGLIDHLEGLVNSIDNRLERLSARQ